LGAASTCRWTENGGRLAHSQIRACAVRGKPYLCSNSREANAATRRNRTEAQPDPADAGAIGEHGGRNFHARKKSPAAIPFLQNLLIRLRSKPRFEKTK